MGVSEGQLDTRCKELGYTELCLDEEDLLLYGGSPEECEMFTDPDPETL